ncbi:hypothetical protein KDA_31380 [Dictyobacter alpinus]|uniref:Uncharacterized protein n=1 Tax=Dictyobacter alpinus TaxID=2014873 RepID=A0A402B8F5_9CHLR|nr:hypothetical protein KDA_31380 [Dictyobacter alpinus]
MLKVFWFRFIPDAASALIMQPSTGSSLTYLNHFYPVHIDNLFSWEMTQETTLPAAILM